MKNLHKELTKSLSSANNRIEAGSSVYRLAISLLHRLTKEFARESLNSTQRCGESERESERGYGRGYEQRDHR